LRAKSVASSSDLVPMPVFRIARRAIREHAKRSTVDAAADNERFRDSSASHSAGDGASNVHVDEWSR
jgi:hypothetical protein